MSSIETPPNAIPEPVRLSDGVRAWVLSIAEEKYLQIDELLGDVATLRVRVAELRATRKTPQNSFVSPSTELE